MGEWAEKCLSNCRNSDSGGQEEKRCERGTKDFLAILMCDMWPNVYVRHDAMPLNKNGKIDRVKLKNEM